jgi:hypothetical protein
MTVETLRTIFLVFLIAEFLLAIFYLRRCQLQFCAYTLWGLFALLVPVLGPFLVILSRPGDCAPKRDPRSRRVRARRR